MINSNSLRWAMRQWGALMVLLVVGCGESVQVTQVSPAEQNLQYIVMAYQQAATDLGRSPAGPDELTPYLAEYGDPQNILLAPSGEPYTVRWKLDLQNVRRGEMPIIAYDPAVDADGAHLAVDLRLAVEPRAAAELAALPTP